MSQRLTVLASLALPLLMGMAWAQGDPQSVGVAVDGTVVEVPVDLAAKACGVSAETLLAQWKQLDTQTSTMANTSVAADAADLAPVAAPDDTQKQAGVGADAAETKDAAHGDGNPVAAAAAPQASAAANPQDALDGSAAPTEGTALSKAAVCEIDAQKAGALGIKVPG